MTPAHALFPNGPKATCQIGASATKVARWGSSQPTETSPVYCGRARCVYRQG